MSTIINFLFMNNQLNKKHYLIPSFYKGIIKSILRPMVRPIKEILLVKAES